MVLRVIGKVVCVFTVCAGITFICANSVRDLGDTLMKSKGTGVDDIPTTRIVGGLC